MNIPTAAIQSDSEGLESVRRRAGLSRERVAAMTHTTSGTVRLYEANPLAVKDVEKRAALDRVYGRLVEYVAAASA